MVDQLLSSRAHVFLTEFLDTLEDSQATFKCDLEFLRDQFNALIVYNLDINAYRFERRGSTGPKYELPGLWLDSGEAYALLSSQPVAIKQRVRAAGAAGCTTKVTPQGAAVG
jgi:hypothetical protein